MDEAYKHCEALVRERERARFLATLFAPAEKRPHLFALYAFDIEIAHIPDAVREPMAGEIRLQWWREALTGDRAEEAKANPVSAALLDTIEQSSLPKEMLIGMLDARRFDLLAEPMSSHEQLVDYLDRVFGASLGMATKILDRSFDDRNAVNFGGRAIGLTRILRDFARDIAKGRLYVPLDRLAAHEVHTASVLGGQDTDGLRAALSEMLENARAILEKFRAIALPQPVLPAFLPVALIPIYLARFAKIRDPFRLPVELSGLRSQFEIWRAGRFGRF